MTHADIAGEHFEQFLKLFRDAASSGGFVVLTGAGVSAESGIPTFRGAEGYWTVGSQAYQPQELATNAFFCRHPETVWGWYLYRWGLCSRAVPNAAHEALADLARLFGARMTLVTQNVDGLHRRAGSDPDCTYEIHGNLDWMRCHAGCSRTLVATPDTLRDWRRDRIPGAPERLELTCGHCGAWMRPHVLWFDEYYEEEYFRSDSSLARVAAANLLLVVGTSGATSLPLQMAELASQQGIPVLSIDPNETLFAQGSTASHLQASAATALPWLLQALDRPNTDA